MHKHFCFFLLWFIPFTLSAQRTISGRITDAEDGSPIPGAAVFIANTTAGTATDADGYYQLKIQGEGTYQLVVSHVGFQPFSVELEHGKSSQTVDVAMREREFDEVEITAKVRARNIDKALFWKSILGTAPSKRTIQATNPDDVFFHYNSETKKLTVSSRVPLQIINHETGYQIQFVLNYFTHDYTKDISSWEGQYMFTELEPENLKQQKIWKKNRKEVYQVSIANFIKSLYQNTLSENGFLLTTQKWILEDFKYNFHVTNLDEFISTDSIDQSKTLYASSDLYLFSYGKPIEAGKELSDLNRTNRPPYKSGLYRAIIRTPGKPVQIFPDGTYKNLIWFSSVYDSQSITGLNKFLPVDYLPDHDAGLPEEVVVTEGQYPNSEIGKFVPFIQALQNFSQNIPQEKVYLHFDNTGYYQDDQIWFKCYVTSGQRQLSDLSKTLYVELLNPGGEVIDKRILKIENGQCHGEFTLDHLPFYSGFYEVRAYTKYMLNFGDDVMFSRLLPVFDKPKEEGNFEEKKMIRYSKWGIRNFPIKRETPEMGKKVNLRFFPEGGNLVQGVASRVAFEATDEIGNPIDITGVVMDDAKKELCKFTSVHEGRGVFTYTPAGVSGRRKDIAEVNYSGKKYQFDLPDALPQGIVMEVDHLSHPDSMSITLRKNSSTPAGIFGITVLNGGRLQNIIYLNIEEDEGVFTMDQTQLPSGVSQIALFNSKGEILCDRLIFTNMNELLNNELFDIKVISTVRQGSMTTSLNDHTGAERSRSAASLPKPHELVDMEILLTDKEESSVNATFSLSIRDGDNEVECKHNILTDLLLMSEIKGYVRNPSYYFTNAVIAGLTRNPEGLNKVNPQKQEIAGQARNDGNIDETRHTPSLHLDQLLMVQGWRRYSWKQMAGVEPFEINYLPEQGIETHGNVVSFVKHKPQPNVDVSMLLMNKKLEEDEGSSFTETFVTDEQGRFSFVSNVTGRWSMILSVTEKGKKKDHRILLDRVFSPEPKQYRYADMQVNIAEKNSESMIDEETTDQPDDDAESFLAAYRDSIAKLSIDEKVHQLKEVTIKGKKNVKEQDIRRNRSTSVAYYDVTQEMDDLFDKGVFVGKDIHELLINMDNNFKINISSGRRPEPTLNVVYGYTEPAYHKTLLYKQKKPLFIINYEVADFSKDFGFEYFKYLTIRLNAIKSIYINESPSVICQYCIVPMASCIDKTQMFGCVVFIETYQGKIPVDGAKGVRKTWLEGYSPAKEFYSPNYSELPPTTDYRRTLYWNPNVTTDENGKARIEFYNNSRCTNFSISAETVTTEGRIGKYRNN